MLLSFVLVLVLVLMLVPVLVLVLVPCSFCFSSPSCSSCPSWSSFVVLVRGPRCQRCAGSSYFFCLRACPPAGRAAQGEPPRDGGQKYALTCSMCIFPLLLFKPSSQQIHLVTSRAERAPSRWREFPAKLFSERRRPLRTGGCSAGQSARAAPRMALMWAVRGKDSRGQSASSTAEMRHRASSHCTR